MHRLSFLSIPRTKTSILPSVLAGLREKTMVNTISTKFAALILFLVASTHIVIAQSNYAIVIGIDDYTTAGLAPLVNAAE